MHQTGSRIIAEGVETSQELSALQKLGVENAQGYLLGRPMPLVQATKRQWKPYRPVNEQEDAT